MGKMVTFKRPDGQRVSGYLAEPAQAQGAPAVVVIQEWWGLNAQIKGVANRLAEAGYVALVPDLYRGKSTVEAEEAHHLMSALDFGDVKFLVQLLGEANEVCQEFDCLFHTLLRHVFLKDGKIDAEEQEVLMDMLFAGGSIRESELKLLRDLHVESTEVTPEFNRLCEIALADYRFDTETAASFNGSA